MLKEQLAVQVGVARALFQDDVLQVRGHRVPAVGVHREPAVTHGNDGADQVVGHLVPAQTVPARTAGNRAVNDAPLQRGVHVGERDELRVGAHSRQQVAEHRAVAADFETLQVIQAVNLRLGEDVVVRRHHVGNLDAPVLQGDLRHLGLDGVNHVQLVLLGCEQSPQVAHVHDWEVPAHVAGVNLRRVQRAVLDQAQRVRPGDAQFGEGRDLEHDLPVGAPLDALHEADVLGLSIVADGQAAVHQRPVDAGHLELEALAGGCQRGEVEVDVAFHAARPARGAAAAMGAGHRPRNFAVALGGRHRFLPAVGRIHDVDADFTDAASVAAIHGRHLVGHHHRFGFAGGAVGVDDHAHDGPDFLIENLDALRVGAAGALHPVGNDGFQRGDPHLGLHVVGEIMVFHPLFDVEVDAVRVPLGLQQPPVLRVKLPAHFLQNLLVGRRKFGPLLAVHGHVGNANGADDRPIEIVGDFVPALAVARRAAGDSGVQYAALQGGVHVREGHELPLSAQARQQVAQDGAVLANVLAIIRVQAGQGFPAEDILVRIVGAEDWLTARGLPQNPHHVVLNGVGQGEVGVVAGRKAPEVAHIDDRQVAANVARVNLGEFEGVIVDQPDGVRAGQSQLGIGRNLNSHFTVRPFRDPGSVEAVDQFAGPQRSVDAHYLERNGFLGCRRRRSLGLGALLAFGGRRRGRRFGFAAAAARGHAQHQQGDGGHRNDRAP